jgi:hypothetical protein
VNPRNLKPTDQAEIMSLIKSKDSVLIDAIVQSPISYRTGYSPEQKLQHYSGLGSRIMRNIWMSDVETEAKTTTGINILRKGLLFLISIDDQVVIWPKRTDKNGNINPGKSERAFQFLHQDKINIFPNPYSAHVFAACRFNILNTAVQEIRIMCPKGKNLYYWSETLYRNENHLNLLDLPAAKVAEPNTKTETPSRVSFPAKKRESDAS